MTVQEYLLITLMEECSEVIKECSKALRFGLNSTHMNVDHDVTTRQCIANEMIDVVSVAELLVEKGCIPTFWNLEKKKAKLNKLKKYMDIATEKGKLT